MKQEVTFKMYFMLSLYRCHFEFNASKHRKRTYPKKVTNIWNKQFTDVQKGEPTLLVNKNKGLMLRL